MDFGVVVESTAVNGRGNEGVVKGEGFWPLEKYGYREVLIPLT